jgi:hypothetical protein
LKNINMNTPLERTDPLTGEARDYAEKHGGLNIHQAAAAIDAQVAPIDGMSKAMRDARAELDRADAIKVKAEAKLREEIAAANHFVNLLAEIRVLKNDLETASLALREYQSCVSNAAINFQTWPGQVRGVGHFGAWAREFGVQIATASAMIPLFTDWLPSARERLATLEKEAAAFAKAHGLKHEASPATN